MLVGWQWQPSLLNVQSSARAATPPPLQTSSPSLFSSPPRVARRVGCSGWIRSAREGKRRGRLTSLQSGQLAASSSAIPLHFKSKGEDGPARRRRTKIVKGHAPRARKPLVEIEPFNESIGFGALVYRSQPAELSLHDPRLA